MKRKNLKRKKKITDRRLLFKKPNNENCNLEFRKSQGKKKTIDY